MMRGVPRIFNILINLTNERVTAVGIVLWCVIYGDTDPGLYSKIRPTAKTTSAYIHRVTRRFRENRLYLVYYTYATDRFKMNKLLRACIILYIWPYIPIYLYVCDCILHSCTYIKYNISKKTRKHTFIYFTIIILYIIIM